MKRGRPRTISQDVVEDVITLYWHTTIPAARAARSLGISRAHFYRIAMSPETFRPEAVV